MHPNPLRRAASALVAVLLAACGGGDGLPVAGTHPSAAQASTASAATPTEAAAAALRASAESRKRALAVPVLASVTVVDPLEAARQLMDFAEAQFPGLFPGPASTAALAPFVYRAYPGGVLLGVVVDDDALYAKGGVYVLGGAFGSAPALVGRVDDFIAPAAPGARVTAESDTRAVVQGSSRALRLGIERLHGYTGPVQLTLTGLPAGVTAAPVTVAPGATQAEFQLVAAPTAPHSLPTPARLTAAIVLAGRARSAEASITVTVRGTPGSVDTSFADDGVQITPVGSGEDHAHAVAVQGDGKVVTVGTAATGAGIAVALTRHLRDGGLDPAFGNGGKVTTRVGARGDSARAVALQADGGIVVAGWSDEQDGKSSFLVLRYRGDGTLDPAFGDGGRVVVPFGSSTDRAHAVAIQDDGRIVVAGTMFAGSNTTGQDFALLRLRSDGTLDAGFGNGGKVVTPMRSGTSGDVVYALALPVVDGEQRIVAAGGESDFVVARYTAAGVLDASFGQGGRVTGLFGSSIGAARALALLPGGRMALAGGIGNDFAAAQLMEDGTPDTMFGNVGRVTVAVRSTNWDQATAVVRQADGRLLLAGWAYSGNSSSADFVALRLLPGGAPDPTFGDEGIVIQPVAAGTRSDSARGLALQADERVPAVRAILGGEANGANNDFALLRLWL